MSDGMSFDEMAEKLKKQRGVDARKLTMLTDEIANLSKQIADLQRQNALLREAVEVGRIVIEIESSNQKLRVLFARYYERAHKDTAPIPIGHLISEIRRAQAIDGGAMGEG